MKKYKNDDKVFIITSGKGGVGKTTLASNIGVSLARMGHKTCLIDGDVGLRNLDLLLGAENKCLHSALDVMQGEVPLSSAIIKDERWPFLGLIQLTSVRQKYILSKEDIQNLIDEIHSIGYKNIIIDSPAGIDNGFFNSLVGATSAIIVTTPDIASIRDADRVVGILESRLEIKDINLLVNRIIPKSPLDKNFLSVLDVQKLLGLPVLEAIPEDKQVSIAANRGVPLTFNLENDEWFSPAGMAFDNAATRLLDQSKPIIDFKPHEHNLVQNNIHKKSILSFLKNYFTRGFEPL